MRIMVRAALRRAVELPAIVGMGRQRGGTQTIEEGLRGGT
jgi:hypothetical protein